MGNRPPRLAILLFVLALSQSLAHAQASGPSRDEVGGFLDRMDSFMQQISSDLNTMQGMTGYVTCGAGQEATCRQALARADVVLSVLRGQRDAAKAKLASARSGFDSQAPMSEVLKNAGDSLVLINSGLESAAQSAQQIPSTCTDADGNDICYLVRQPIDDSLFILGQTYRYRKAEYDALAAQLPSLSPDQLAAQDKNDRLAGVYPNLGRAQDMRATIADLEQSGASEQTLSASRVELAGLEKKTSDVYDSILLDPRFKHDFWTNWDYATLKKNQGDFAAAQALYAAALSDARVSEQDKKDFMAKLQKESQSSLGLAAPPPADDKVVKSMRESLREQYDKLKLMGFSTYMDFHASFVFTLAKAGNALNEMKQFRDAFTGQSIENAAGEAGQ